MQPEAAAAFNLAKLDRAFLDDPYPTYRALREHDLERLAVADVLLRPLDARLVGGLPVVGQQRKHAVAH